MTDPSAARHGDWASSGRRRRPLRVALVVPYYDPRVEGDPAVWLTRFPSVPELAAELARLGLDVQAYHLSDRRAEARWSGVAHHFVPTGRLQRALARWLWRRAPRFEAPYFELAFGLVRRVLRSRPDVVHVFGLNLDPNVALLTRAAARQSVPVVAHYHGGAPAEDASTRRLQRSGVARMARVLFTHAAQAEPWCRAVGLRTEQVGVVVETSTRAPRVPRPSGTSRTLDGDPACAIVGRLHPIKDPVTALAAFAIVAESVPKARLHVFYGSDAFAGRLPALVQAVPSLANRVVFYGYTKPRVLTNRLASADILLQASRREWSSLSVIEALSAGVVPVLTDIPAFRALTANGRVGRLVPVGDAQAMAAAVIELASDRGALARLSRAGRASFVARLSFAALARDVAAVYGDVVAGAGASSAPSGKRSRRSARSTTPPVQ